MAELKYDLFTVSVIDPDAEDADQQGIIEVAALLPGIDEEFLNEMADAATAVVTRAGYRFAAVQEKAEKTDTVDAAADGSSASE